jgi:hypothetical protein
VVLAHDVRSRQYITLREWSRSSKELEEKMKTVIVAESNKSMIHSTIHRRFTMKRLILAVMTLTTSFAMLLMFALPSPVSALPFAEIGDAGDRPGSAQVIAGAGSLDSIKGSIGVSGDADMYGIFITGLGTFSATTVGTSGSFDDTQLFLFTSAGIGVYANDDNVGFRSLLPAGNGLTPLAPGLYYLAISGFDKDPISAGGLIFPSTPFNGLFGPTGVGGGSGITGYTSSSTNSGSYTINLTGAQFVSASVPEPSALLLLGAGLAGIGIWRRKAAKG